jgi:hypothetical protein
MLRTEAGFRRVNSNDTRATSPKLSGRPLLAVLRATSRRESTCRSDRKITRSESLGFSRQAAQGSVQRGMG